MSGALLSAGVAALTVKTALAGPVAPAAASTAQALETGLAQTEKNAIESARRLVAQAPLELERAVTNADVAFATKRAEPAQTLTVRSPGSSLGTAVNAAPSGTADGARDSNRVSSKALARLVLDEAARRHGLDPRVVLALAWWESDWDQSKVSATGAVGLMQVEPGSAQSAGPALLGRPVDITDPYDNADVGAAILREDLDNFGDIRMALAAYYQGPASLRQNGMLPDTEQYVDGIMSLATRIE